MLYFILFVLLNACSINVISFLSAKIGLPVAAEPLTDKSGRTPLSAVFWNITKDDIPEDMR